MNIISKLAIVTLVSAMASPVYSFGLSLPGSKKEASAPTVDSYAAQDALVKQYTVAVTDVTSSQQMFAEALGLKQEVAEIQESIDVLESGAVMDEDAIERVTASSNELNEQLQAKMAESGELSAEAKAQYSKGFLPLLKGLYETKKVGDEAQTYIGSAKQTISTASMMNKMSVTNKLSAGMYVAKEMPGFSKNLFNTSKDLFAFAKKQGIPVPDDATALAADMGFEI
jgi:hypothetical protein